MNKRPNILLITVDQMRFDHLGLKGVKGIETPNLDRLGREGIHFDRAYTCSPVCTPARLSLITGQYPSVHGGWTIGVSPEPFPRPLLPATLKAGGYATALIGKHHFVNRKDEQRHISGKDEYDPDFYRAFDGPYAGFDFCRLSTGHTTDCIPDQHYRLFLDDAGVDFKEWFPISRFADDYAIFCADQEIRAKGSKALQVEENGSWTIPPEYTDTAWVGKETIEYIQRHKDSEPWFCMANFQDPHSPFKCPEPYFSNVRKNELELFTDAQPGEFDDKPPFYNDIIKWERSAYADEFDIPNILPSAADPEKKDEEELINLQTTLGMVKHIDDKIGEILAALEESAQAEHTLVIFTCDHGEMHGEHGVWGKGIFAYDGCQRVPMLVWGPGLVKEQGTSAALANLVDLPRTLLSMTGCDIPQGMQGVDLSQVLTGEKESVQDATLIEFRATEKIYQQTLVTDQHKLVVYDIYEEGELYDMQNDPGQVSNLWNDPASAELKAGLLLELAQSHMRQEGLRRPRTAFA